ncbi:MAG: NAD-dependent epimerase/dehydratase family protein [Bacteroidetes bacterium]|nr:NAD-dependent epimerase/dehydratase family protein [Bacteroidota bacterium]MDA1019725.1 NAD-dependent epimerase/dehydratase family protein [Bacteroidota bacterium]
MDRILITGALGQLGLEFIKYFKKSDTFVLATDIRNPHEKLSCEFEKADVLNKERLDLLVKKYEINTIYHLVAILSANGEKNPFISWNVNMNSFQNIVEISVDNNIKNIFWPSSIAVFGTDSNLDFVPQNPSMNPETIYGVSKLAGEKLSSYYSRKFGLDIRSLRYPGIISTDTLPGGGTTDYIIEMLNAAKNKSDYTCFLSKETRLPMMYIDDAIDAAVKLMSVERKKLTISSSYNISGFSITPSELEDQIKSRGFNIKINYKPDFRQEIANSWPKEIDDSSSIKDWGWSCNFGLKETLDKVFS